MVVLPTRESIQTESVPGFINGCVGFHCRACEIRFPSKPTKAEMGAMFSSVWVTITLKSKPSFLLSRKRKLEVRLAVIFLRFEVLITPSWFKYPADKRYLAVSLPPPTATL